MWWRGSSMHFWGSRPQQLCKLVQRCIYDRQKQTPEVFCGKGIFAIFTGKHLAGILHNNFIKKRLQHRSFPVKIAKFLRTAILKLLDKLKASLDSLFNKIAGFQGCNSIKKRFQHRCFPVNVAKFLRTPILKNINKRLFLNVSEKQSF